MIFAEEALTHLRQHRHMSAIQDEAVGLYDVLGRHACHFENGADILPDQFGLRCDVLGHAVVGSNAGLPRDMQEPPRQGGFDTMFVMPKWAGDMLRVVKYVRGAIPSLLSLVPPN